MCSSEVHWYYFEELSEALPQSPKSDEDRDREFQEQFRDVQARKLTQ